MSGIVHERAVHLVTTDDLINHYALVSDLPRAALEAAIPAAIDAVYMMRDRGGGMHAAGAAAAVEALSIARAQGGF